MSKIEAELIGEHSGCGHGIQVDQITVRLAPGDKAYIVRGKLGRSLLPVAHAVETFYVTPQPAPPSADAGMLAVLILMVDAFLSRHGCFPLDKTNDDERLWCAAMTAAYQVVGQPNTPERESKLAALAAAETTRTKGVGSHCAERKKPGGCQLHNLHCGYPDCDRLPAAPKQGGE